MMFGIKIWAVFISLAFSWPVLAVVQQTLYAAERSEAEQLFENEEYEGAYAVYSSYICQTDLSVEDLEPDLAKVMECLIDLNRAKDVEQLGIKIIHSHIGHPEALRELSSVFDRCATVYADKVTQNVSETVGKSAFGWGSRSDRLGFYESGWGAGFGSHSPLDDEYLRFREMTDLCRKLTLYALDAAVGQGDGVCSDEQTADICIEYAAKCIAEVVYDNTVLPSISDRREWSGFYGEISFLLTDISPVLSNFPVTVLPSDGTLFYKEADKYAKGWRHWYSLVRHAEKLDPKRKKECDLLVADFSCGVARNMFGYFSFYHEEYYWGLHKNCRNLSFDSRRFPNAIKECLKADDNIMFRRELDVDCLCLPKEFSFICIYKKYGALQKLLPIYVERQQYGKALDCIKTLRKNGSSVKADGYYDDITQKTGHFGFVDPQAAGQNAEFEFISRNVDKVTFSAYSLNKEDFEKRCSYEEGGSEGELLCRWTVDIDVIEPYFAQKTVVKSPLKDAGLYRIEQDLASEDGGDAFLKINDLALFTPSMLDIDNNIPNLYVGEIADGEPVSNARAELTVAVEAEEFSDAGPANATNSWTFVSEKDGWVRPGHAVSEWIGDRSIENYIYRVTTQDGRQGTVWPEKYGCIQTHYNGYNYSKKTYIATDRPEYRPGDDVHFAGWVRSRPRPGKIANYQGEKVDIKVCFDHSNATVFDSKLKLDEFGRFNAKFKLPDDARLGSYGINGHSFQVEEYKKPEFKIKITGPETVVQMGEKAPVRIAAKYYHGAPVQNATAKISVYRRKHFENYRPDHPWNWFYHGWLSFRSERDYDWLSSLKAPPFEEKGDDRCYMEVFASCEIDLDADGMATFDVQTLLPGVFEWGSYDHKYDVHVSVVDRSRRKVSGRGSFIAANPRFRAKVWCSRGFYSAGEEIEVFAEGQTLSGLSLAGQADISIDQIMYDSEWRPVTNTVFSESQPLDENGLATVKAVMDAAGQYRVRCKVTTTDGRVEEVARVMVVRDAAFDGLRCRFDPLEVIADKESYAPGETAQLLINSDEPDAIVWLYTHSENCHNITSEMLRMKGKSVVVPLAIDEHDFASVCIQALTVKNGVIHLSRLRMAVPPQDDMLDVSLATDKDSYKAGENVDVSLDVVNSSGEPVSASIVLSVYDASFKDPAGSGFMYYYFKHNFSHDFLRRLWFVQVPWRSWGSRSALSRVGSNLFRKAGRNRFHYAFDHADDLAEPEMRMGKAPGQDFMSNAGVMLGKPTLRREFMDTAYWNGALKTDSNGVAQVSFNMPDNLGAWKLRAWVMDKGMKAGFSEMEVTTSKDLLLRMQAPRFFVEGDEVVLSANVHNYLSEEKEVRVVLEIDGSCLQMVDDAVQIRQVQANDEVRVDWRLRVLSHGGVVIRMKALTDEESDAMQRTYPVLVHGIEKVESFSGSLRPEDAEAERNINIPEKCRPDETRLDIRWSPTLAGAMLEALPYLADYPYGCTEQTMSRFLPAVLTRKVLTDLGLDLERQGKTHSNLNTQELGKSEKQIQQLRSFESNPVYCEEALETMIETGLRRLGEMQCSDGGWRWFPDDELESTAYLTAHVVHGLRQAVNAGVEIDETILEMGVSRLESLAFERLERLNEKTNSYRCVDLDAFVFMVLADEGFVEEEMQKKLFEQHKHLSVYGMCMLGLAMDKIGDTAKRDVLIQQIEQYLVQDAENQTAWLQLRNKRTWWYWYGDEIETMSYYLKLLCRTDPKSDKASGLVKYLLNNRQNGSYWKSTRDTAVCLEAMSEYIRATGEMNPDMFVEVLVDNKVVQATKVTSDNLFTIDNTLTLDGDELKSGKHSISFRKKGRGPLFYNAYLSYFSLENPIKKTGLEIKVERKYFKLSDGNSIPVTNLSEVVSGDLIEVVFEVNSKNDYEYILLADPKPAGFEPVSTRSGYGSGGYIEYRDEEVCFFIEHLPRGLNKSSYLMRAEIPGKFSALPAQVSAMYAPELRCNSDEWKVNINDQ